MKLEAYFGDHTLPEVELEYTVRQLQLFCKELKGMTEHEADFEPDEGWRGVYAFTPEYFNVDVEGEELLFCNKPVHGPYIELSLCILIQDKVFKENVKAMVDIMSRYGVSLALDPVEGAEPPGAINLQLTLRLFSSAFSVEVLDLALENLISCKGALIEFLISIGIESEPGYE